MLEPLGEMAARLHVTVIANTHLSKATAGAPTAASSAQSPSSIMPEPLSSSRLTRRTRASGCFFRQRQTSGDLVRGWPTALPTQSSPVPMAR